MASIKKIFFDLKSSISDNPIGSDEGLIQFDHRHYDYSSGKLKPNEATYHGAVYSENNFNSLNYIDRVLLPQYENGDGQHPAYSFFARHLLKIAFHKRALLSEWQSTAIFNFSVESFHESSGNNSFILSKAIRSVSDSYGSASSFHGSAFGLFSLGASSALFMRAQNIFYPVIPILFFGLYPIHSQSFDNTISNPYKNIRLYPFILQGFIVLRRVVDLQNNQTTTNTAIIFVHNFRNIYVKPIHHSDFNQALPDEQLRSNYILVSKENRIKFDVYRDNYITGSIERTRYILRVENLNPESSYRYAALRYEVPIVKTRLETQHFYESLPNGFDSIFSNSPSVNQPHIPSDSFFISSYADRIGIFESSFVDTVEENNTVSKKIYSLNPETSLFQIYVNYSRDSDIAIISDSVGLGYGVTLLERSSNVPVLGSSFASELKRTAYRQANNLSRIFLTVDDVIESLRNIKFLNPSYIILFLGMDTVARLSYKHASMFQVSNVDIGGGDSFITYKFFRPKNFSLIDIFDSNNTVSPADYSIKKFFHIPSNNDGHKGLYQLLKDSTSSNIVVVGFPPVNVNRPESQRTFYEFYNNYNFIGSGSTNSVLPICLQYSGMLQQRSVNFDFYVNLSYELGNPTTYDQRYVSRYANQNALDAGISSLYFNSSGHNVLKELIFGIIREQVFRTTTLMNQRDIDVRLSITKFVSKQKVYSLQDNQNYSIYYDAKLDIVLPVFRADEDFRKLDIGTNELYNMLIIIPYAGSVAVRLRLQSGETTNLLLMPNRPTMLFVPFDQIFLRNNSEIEVPITIILGKTF